MKTVLILLSFPLFLLADSLYLLPHQWQDARHHLSTEFFNLPGPVTIITDTLHDTLLRHAIEKRLARHRHIVLMTPSIRTASRWAIYRDIDVCVLRDSAALGYSLITAKTKKGCLLSLPLTTEAFHGNGMMQCSDIVHFQAATRMLKKECTPYFSP